MLLLDGKKSREYYKTLLIERIKKLSLTPHLNIIQIGNRPDSDAYVKAKKSFAEKIGVKIIHIQLDEKISQNEVLEIIKKCNQDNSTQGIIIQLPLPSHLNTELILESVNPNKDVDGLTCDTKFMPATARGVKELFKFYKIELFNKKITVVGRSKLVGTPIANMCHEEGAKVVVCHSQTENIPEKTKSSDILIVAIGKPNLIDEKYINENQIVIDVGITRHIEEGLVGDVDFHKVKDIVGMITPVPGGVGQMTVLALFENLVDACYNRYY
jgi:methylenetetrahydrofolate dehydrogenase (NADP+)/methenyltetrahydrofolate cyclohydrolase